MKEKFRINQIVTTKESFLPLYKKGDKFKIIKLNKNEDLVQVEAVSLRTKEICGFGMEELEVVEE